MPQVNLDCEGPLTLNDNAFELCAAFIPRGEHFFALVSRYDDYLADVERRPGYKAGDTLRLVLPFLVAHGVTNKIVREFSQKTLKMLPGTPDFLNFLRQKIPAFIISTSYRPYLEALSQVTGFPLENIFCTEVDFDRYRPSKSESSLLKELAQEIASMPMIHIPEGAQSMTDLPAESQRVILRLEQIFWEIIPTFQTGRFLEDVNPIGGIEKARATQESVLRTGLSLEEVLYVGDSITDVEAFNLVRKEQGATVAFNGNIYALKAAEFYALAFEARVLKALAHLFARQGRDGLLDLALKGPALALNGPLAEIKGLDFKFGLVEGEDFPSLVEESLLWRKRVRGRAIGALG